MSKITLTALVTAFPPDLRSPKPLPGENIFQLVIRNHKQQWQKCIERLKKDFNLNEEMCSRLQKGEQFEFLDFDVKNVVDRFMNLRLPTPVRTLRGLAEIRDELLKPAGFREDWNLQITDILWPRWKNPNIDKQTENIALSYGVTIVGVAVENSNSISIGSFVNQIHGEYLWKLPGGTRLSGTITEMALYRVLLLFKKNPKLAFYSDQCYCLIYRTSALRALIASGKILSSDDRENARMIEEAGYDLAADNNPILSLVKLESIYGGKYDSNMIKTGKSVSKLGGKTSWWQRIFGSR